MTRTLASRLEAAAARKSLDLPAALLRILAGKPIVRDGQTLDVQTQALLQMQKLRGTAGLGGRPVARERKLMDAQCAMLAPIAPEIETQDIQLAGGAGPIDGRIYSAPRRATGRGALVFYHGGGFVVGSLDSHDGICRALAQRAGCVVVSVAYRLAPEHKAPAGVEDAIAAFRDITARADEFDIDAARVAVGGDSAGGNLSTVVAQAAADDACPPCFQLLFYPTLDFAVDRESIRTFGKGFLLEQSSMDWFHGHYLPDGFDLSDPRISPIYGPVAGIAPAFVMTAGFDPLRDEGEAYADVLRQAGVEVELVRKPTMIHGFLNFAGAVLGADAALTEASRALARALKA